MCTCRGKPGARDVNGSGNVDQKLIRGRKRRKAASHGSNSSAQTGPRTKPRGRVHRTATAVDLACSVSEKRLHESESSKFAPAGSFHRRRPPICESGLVIVLDDRFHHWRDARSLVSAVVADYSRIASRARASSRACVLVPPVASNSRNPSPIFVTTTCARGASSARQRRGDPISPPPPPRPPPRTTPRNTRGNPRR